MYAGAGDDACPDLVTGRTDRKPEQAADVLKKLLFRLDGAADSAKTTFTSELGNLWEAELSLHSGTLQQSPRLMILFRNRSRPDSPQRYTLAPPGVSKVPDEAVKQLAEEDLRELLARSAQV